MEFEAADLSGIYEQVAKAFPKLLGMPDDLTGEENTLAVAGDGADEQAALTAWLHELITLRRDFEFVVQSAEGVEASAGKVSCKVSGVYLDDAEFQALKFETIKLEKAGAGWRATVTTEE